MNTYNQKSNDNSRILLSYFFVFIIGFFACLSIINFNSKLNTYAKLDNSNIVANNTVCASYLSSIENDILQPIEIERIAIESKEIDEMASIEIYSSDVIVTSELDEYIESDFCEDETIIEEMEVIDPIDNAEDDKKENTVKEIVKAEDTYYNFTNLGYSCSTKTYGDWKSVTDKSSEAYNLLHNTQVHICDDGMLRDDEGYVCAALGTYFADVGSRWVFVTKDGKEIKVIKCDDKANCDADSAHIMGIPNNDIIEFYIEPSKFEKEENGLVHWGNFNCVDEYNGSVIGWYQVDTWYTSDHH